MKLAPTQVKTSLPDVDHVDCNPHGREVSAVIGWLSLLIMVLVGVASSAEGMHR